MATRQRLLVAAAIGFVVVLIVAAASIGATRWARETAVLERELATATISGRSTVSFADLAGLPAPVQRYLRLALHDGQPRIVTTRLEQSGRLRTGVESDQWLAFDATETMAPEARGFVWDARVRVAPLVHVRVRDAYTNGVGAGTVAFQSTVTVSDERGGHELNEGDLLRLLAEAAWCPTLLLPRADLAWTALDDHRALATLTDRGETAAIEFRFNEAGEIAGLYAAARPRSYGTTYVATPWEGHFSQYVTVDGVRVPLTGEVGWWVDGRWVPVWHGTVTRVAFDFLREGSDTGGE